jgi:tripartite-type tricarboxylate transporter receptor subunit TctC
MMNIQRRNWIISYLGMGLTAPSIWAQSNWPDKPIRVISAGSPGGSSDIFVRIIENRMKEKLGQPLFIDNKPGAGGMTAAGIASVAAPNGLTLFVSNLATNAIGVTLYSKPSFNPQKDLPPVARIATMTNAVAVRSDSGIQNMQQLIAILKSDQKKAFYGSAGIGTSSHLTGHILGKAMGANLTHVPYKGTAANLNALLAGEVLFCVDNLPVYTSHVKAGTLKLLAVTQAQRLNSMPEVPTVQESAGLLGFDVFSWFGLSAATGTPHAILERLGSDVVAALKEPEIAEKIRAVGAEPAPLGPNEYKAFINDEIRKWSTIVKSSGATAD